MRLIAMMPVRNEDWVLGLSLRVVLMWCDEVVVLLHACTDRSIQIAIDVQQEHARNRVVVLMEDGEWTEMQHRQRILETARERGATHLAIIDADEVLTGNLIDQVPLLARAAGPIHQHSQPATILELPGYNLRNPALLGKPQLGFVAKDAGLCFYHSNGVWGNRWFSTAFEDDARLSWTGDRFHHREPLGVALKQYRPIQQGQGGVMHLWGASERRLRAKHALYKVTERLRWPHKHVSQIDREYSWAIHGDKQNPSFGTPATWTYSTVPESWWAPYAHLMKYLDLDAVPYQEAETRRLVAEHGHEKFSALDLFGVA